MKVGKPMVANLGLEPTYARNNDAGDWQSLSLRRDRSVLVLPILQLIVGLILLVDIGGELHAALIKRVPLGLMMLFHLISEAIATVLLGVAFLLSSRQRQRHLRALTTAHGRMGKLRGDFASLVTERFHAWNLSPSETEIALLTVKGLKIAEIARLRDCRESTIKSHLSAIFRKAGVASQTELLAKFVDDFLDFSAGHTDTPPAPN